MKPHLAAGDAHALDLPLPELTAACVYFLASAAAMWLTRVDGGLSLIWPPAAIVAALFIRAREVRWTHAALLLAAAGLAANLLIAHRAWQLALSLTALNLIEVALAVGVFRFMLRFPYPSISIEQSAIMTALFGIAIPGFLAFAAGTALNVYEGSPALEGVRQWWCAHAIGACLFGPPIILYSHRALKRLLAPAYRLQNLLILILVAVSCVLAIRYVQFPFVVIGLPLLIAAFYVGAFGASILGLTTGITIAALWAFGVRPGGPAGMSALVSLSTLPVTALLATVMPPVAVGLGSDVRRGAVRKLNASERRFRESMAHSPIGMLIADLNGTWGYTNLALQKMLGYSGDELSALPPGGPSDPHDWNTSADRWGRLLTDEIQFYEVERRFRHKNGHWIWAHVAVSLLRDEDGRPQNLIAQIESLEARRQAEATLAEERERLRITLKAIDEAVITTDVQTRINFMNAAAETLLGLRGDQAQGRHVQEILHLIDPQTSKTAANLLGQCAIHGEVFRRDTPCLLHRPDGSMAFVADTVSPMFDGTGAVTGLVMVLRDVGGEVSRAQDLNHRATHDPLTNLANRFEFQRRLTEAFARAKHVETPAALIALDLDRFKAVNDAGGHAAGDAVLKRVADILRTAVRQSDLVARLGGDEFIILLPHCPEERAMAVAQQILGALNPLEVSWQDVRHSIGASIGLAMLQPALETENAWLAAADQASYQAKTEGRGVLRVARGARVIPLMARSAP